MTGFSERTRHVSLTTRTLFCGLLLITSPANASEALWATYSTEGTTGKAHKIYARGASTGNCAVSCDADTVFTSNSSQEFKDLLARLRKICEDGKLVPVQPATASSGPFPMNRITLLVDDAEYHLAPNDGQAFNRSLEAIRHFVSTVTDAGSAKRHGNHK